MAVSDKIGTSVCCVDDSERVEYSTADIAGINSGSRKFSHRQRGAQDALVGAGDLRRDEALCCPLQSGRRIGASQLADDECHRLRVTRSQREEAFELLRRQSDTRRMPCNMTERALR